MKKKLASLLLALAMCLSLLPLPASAAETEPPDWYFLFAIFKNVDADVGDRNGVKTHETCSMPQEEMDIIRDHARAFEAYMSQTGVMRAHVDVVEIDETVTELAHRDGSSSLLRVEQAAPLLESKVDLDRYDHVSCILNLNVRTGYVGITPSEFENGAGISCINYVNWEYFQNVAYRDPDYWVPQLYTHEFLHFMERMNRRWGKTLDIHLVGDTFYTPTTDDWKSCTTDIILNQVKGNAETGTGVDPAVWQYPPHVMRTMTELTVPSSVTSIGDTAFANNTILTKVTIPGSVTSIGVSAFYDCTSLTEVNILPGVTEIKGFAFRGCSNLTRMSIPASVTSIGDVAIGTAGTIKDIYYSGTEAQWKAIQVGEYNEKLTRANIHYNHLMADVKTTDQFAQPIAWALGQGITGGTGNGKFSPGQNCTVAQILTFLWRANGSPKPAGAVSGGEYYASAVQWAKERGIVTETLTPASPCTRAAAVTYIWRAAGSPAPSGPASFTDVPAGADYAGAVAWAVENGVTSGTSAATFSPNSTCTRGQIVTFLYRALG